MTNLVNKNTVNCNIAVLIKSNIFVKYIDILKFHNLSYGNYNAQKHKISVV